jgi:multidrug efflux pump subunit AcrB
MQVLGIPLQQISIAALIIALGLLVDVPVVASDGINRELHRGEPRLRAAWLGPLRLRQPMVFGTLTCVFSFLPLLMLSGDKGEFMKSMPAVVTLALLSALLVSNTFLPLISYYVLRGQKGFDEGGEVRSFFLFRIVDRTLMALLPRYRAALQGALKRPGLVLGVGYSVLALICLLLFPRLGSQFFPPAERNQLLVDIETPSSDSLTSMRAAVDQVVGVLKKHEEVASAAVFSGGTAPRFYYNVEPKAPANYLAQILINTRQADEVNGLMVKLRRELDESVPGVRCVVKPLEQGPPVNEPVQIRLSGENLDKLRLLADQVAAELRAAGGYHVFDDLGLRMPNIQIDIDQDRANSLGLNNKQIGGVALSSFAGLQVTELREGDRLIPVLVRGRIEDRSEVEKIRALYAPTPDGKSVPFESFSTLKIQPEFVRIPHYNQLRTVTVKAYAPFGELPSQVLDRARPGLAKIKLDPGYELKFAGEDEELRKSKAEMRTVLMVSLALIVITLVLQFRSVIKASFCHLLSLRVHGHAGGDQPDWRDRVQHDCAQRTHRAHTISGSAAGGGAGESRPGSSAPGADDGPCHVRGPVPAVSQRRRALASADGRSHLRPGFRPSADAGHVADALLCLLRQIETHQVSTTLCVHLFSNCHSGPSLC